MVPDDGTDYQDDGAEEEVKESVNQELTKTLLLVVAQTKLLKMNVLSKAAP
uniref:Uncharacterized protein n=1 Tax=Arion vulgaris TaxID=1028688 RepID=A0A0B7AW32_9EUPU